MELIGESRRYFKFTVDDGIKFFCDGIKADGGEIWFPRPAADANSYDKLVFESAEDCEFWAERVMEFKSMERIDKKLYGVKSAALKMSDGDWDMISKFMTNPDRFDPESDVKIFESHLANNFKDRDGERFSLPVLKSFAKTIIGKSKLIGHDWRGLGDGRFYKATLKKMSVDEAIEFIGANPNKKFREHLEYIADKDGGIYWLVPNYYMLNVTDGQQQSVIETEGGLRRDQSIGFRAPELWAIYDDETEDQVEQNMFGREGVDESKNVMYFEYRNNGNTEAEALEGSDVFLGSQYGAQTTKNAMKLKDENEQLKSDVEELKKKVSEFTKDIPLDSPSKGESKAEWSSALINTFEDNCFAYCEPTGEKDDEGKTVPRNARHLPHHAKGNGATGTGGTVDLPHLRNALARMNQVKPVTDKISTESLRAKVKSHLVAHAKKLGIGEYAQDAINSNDGDSKMANFKIDLLDVNMTVSDGEEFEANLKKVEETISKAVSDRFEQMEQEMTDVKQQRDDAVDEMNEVKEKLTASTGFEKDVKGVFGDDTSIEDMKKVKATADGYRDDLVNKTVNIGVLAEMIKDDDVEERKAFFEKLSISEIKVWLDQYTKIHNTRNPGKEIVDGNIRDKNPDPEPEPEPQPEPRKSNATDRFYSEPL